MFRKIRTTKLFFKFSILLFIYTSYQSACGQSQEKIYALHIMNFAKGLQWPDYHNGKNFIIGVLEYPPLSSELKNSSKTVKIGNRNVEVIEFSSPNEIKDCQILFMPAYKAKLFPAVLTQLRADPTLIVTNKMDLARNGSGINFILDDGKVKYEINCKSITDRGLKISTHVKAMGLIVD